jgi:hypothetical protein
VTLNLRAHNEPVGFDRLAPNNTGSYSYRANLEGGALHLNSHLQLNKTKYQPAEYAALRELFARSIMLKFAEQLWLRRAL